MLGALINSVFLIALCFTILVEALQRLFRDEHIHDPDLMLIVGCIGLVINIAGLALFAGHGHSHGKSNTIFSACILKLTGGPVEL